MRLPAAMFWLGLISVAYTYVGFPLIVLARARLRPRPAASAPIEPAVSVVMAAHNEAGGIALRLDNLLALDYPRDRFETIVASDGSADATVRIAEGYADRSVRVLPLGRVGKADALNAAVAAARARSWSSPTPTRCSSPARSGRSWPRSPTRRSAASPVTSATCRGGADDAAGERSYWDFDRRVKLAESEAGSTVSATGAIYAIRQEPVRAGPAGRDR